MKTLKLMVLMLFSMTLVLSSSVVEAQSTQLNYLKLKGKILNNHISDIAVYQYSDSEEWVKIDEVKNRTKFKIRLDPQHNYQVKFTNATGIEKVMEVCAGDYGRWIMYLDINFNKKELNYAQIYQTHVDEPYVLVSSSVK